MMQDPSRISGFEAYSCYLAIKNHFAKRNYDYFKYHGKVSARKTSFDTRRDRFHFIRLGKKFTDHKELELFILANVLGGVSWVGDLLEDSPWEKYMELKRIFESFSYTFDQELSRARASVEEPRDLFRAPRGQYPPILERKLSGEISFPVFSVLDHIILFSEQFDKSLNDPIWTSIRDKSRKLYPFVPWDREKIKLSMKRVLYS